MPDRDPTPMTQPAANNFDDDTLLEFQATFTADDKCAEGYCHMISYAGQYVCLASINVYYMFPILILYTVYSFKGNKKIKPRHLLFPT